MLDYEIAREFHDEKLPREGAKTAMKITKDGRHYVAEQGDRRRS